MSFKILFGMLTGVDATIPRDTVEFRDNTGKVVGKITNIGEPEAEGRLMIRCCICGEVKPKAGGCMRFPSCADCEKGKRDV